MRIQELKNGGKERKQTKILSRYGSIKRNKKEIVKGRKWETKE
jgi:hypothetical protein